MTLKDFLERIDIEKDGDKMLLFSDGRGWTNIWFENNESDITFVADKNLIFSSDK